MAESLGSCQQHANQWLYLYTHAYITLRCSCTLVRHSNYFCNVCIFTFLVQSPSSYVLIMISHFFFCFSLWDSMKHFWTNTFIKKKSSFSVKFFLYQVFLESCSFSFLHQWLLELKSGNIFGSQKMAFILICHSSKHFPSNTGHEPCISPHKPVMFSWKFYLNHYPF